MTKHATVDRNFNLKIIYDFIAINFKLKSVQVSGERQSVTSLSAFPEFLELSLAEHRLGVPIRWKRKRGVRSRPYTALVLTFVRMKTFSILFSFTRKF